MAKVNLEDTIQITVLIAGRPYPLIIKSTDEAFIHQQVNDINLKTTAFQAQYPTKDKQDCLAMTLLATAVDLHRQVQKPSVDEKITRRLRSIEETLDKMI